MYNDFKYYWCQLPLCIITERSGHIICYSVLLSKNVNSWYPYVFLNAKVRKMFCEFDAFLDENSGSQLFRITAGIQSGTDAFDESRFIMIFLTILGVIKILSSFRLVLLKGKTGKGILESSRLEFLEKFLANDFTWSDAEDNTSVPMMNRGGIADLLFSKTLLANGQKSREPGF